MPKVLSILMALAGLGWLAFISNPLATWPLPSQYFMGGIGEGLLTPWLLGIGVNLGRWKQQAGALQQPAV